MDTGGHSPLGEQSGHASCSLLVAQVPVSEAGPLGKPLEEKKGPQETPQFLCGREVSGWFLWCLQQLVICHFT